MASGEQHCDTREEEKLKQAQTISSVDVKAETGGTVISPVFTGNTITGPVTIISTTAGHEPSKISETATAEKDTEKQGAVLSVIFLTMFFL